MYSYVSRENLEALIVDKPSLDEVMNLVFAFLDKNNPSIREIHEYTMALPEKYYTDYGKWVGVAMALKSTSELLLLHLFTFQVNGIDLIIIISVMYWINGMILVTVKEVV